MVEDEDRLLGVLIEMLEDAGYSASGATSAEQALQLAQIGSYDILLCDVSLGDVRGDLLARRLCAVRRFSKIVFMSGWERENVRRWDGAPPERWLRKPFTLGELDSVLRS